MIIGLDQYYNVISVGDVEDIDAFSLKVLDYDYEFDLETYRYKYENGNIINLGFTEKGRPRSEEEKIKEELEELDQTINRATEDLYELTGTTPYKGTGDVIERKKELRQQLKNINEEKTEEKNDTSDEDVSEETSE